MSANPAALLRPRVLLLLASRQAWPNIISVLHFAPETVVLLHTQNEDVSGGPALRLKRFLESSGLAARCMLHPIPEDDYHAIGRALENLPPDFMQPGTALGFNAGTKLLAVACFDWARSRQLQAFYLEDDNELQRFDFSSTPARVATDHPDLSACDSLDALELVRCQLSASEILYPGSLVEVGQPHFLDLSPERFQSSAFAQSSDWLRFRGGREAPQKEGDRLEYAVAATALRLGARQVRLGIELAPSQAPNRSGHTLGELDVVFTLRGRLWVVECKDRKLPKIALGPAGRDPRLAARIKAELRRWFERSQTKNIKEHLLTAHDAGGSLGRLIFVSRPSPSPDVLAFARSVRVGLAWKDQLFRSMESLLLHDSQLQPPSAKTSP